MAHRFLHLNIHYSSFVPGLLEATTPPYWLALICDDWMRYAPSSWMLWTAKTPAECATTIQPALNHGDTFLILPVEASHQAQGLMPQWAWDWINKPRPANMPPSFNYPGALEDWLPSPPAPPRRLGQDPFGGLSSLPPKK